VHISLCVPLFGRLSATSGNILSVVTTRFGLTGHHQVCNLLFYFSHVPARILGYVGLPYL
jgi:hypothetical protein